MPFNRPPAVVIASFFYGAGLVTGLVFLISPWVVLVILIGYSVFAKLTGVGHVGLLYLAGLMVGTAALLDRTSHCSERWEPGSKNVQVVLHDTPDERGMTSATVVRSNSGCDGQISLVFSEPGPEGGSLLSVTGTYRFPVLRVSQATVIRKRESLKYFFRSVVDGRIRTLYGARSGIVAAMVLGRKGDIDPGIRRDFSRAGMAHLLAISGLHVGIIAGWIYLLGGMLGLARLRGLVLLVGVWGYVGLLAFPAPATRAAIFITVTVLAGKLERSPPPISVLAVAAMGVFTIDPAAIQSIGAWLSISAVWGTSLAARELRRFGIESPMARLLGSSVGATLATAPVTVLGFGAAAPIGIISNLVAIPITGLIVPAVFFSLVVGPVLAGGAGMLIWFLETVARYAAIVPGGHFEGRGLVFGATCAVIALIFLWAVRRRPTWLRIRLRLVAGLSVLVWLNVALSTSWASPRSGISVYVLDVGQGDAIVVRTPHSKWILIDGGPKFGSYDAGARVVAPFLSRMGAENLEILFVSHGDSDHLGGVPSLLRKFRPRLVVDPGQPLPSDLFQEYLTVIAELDLEWQAGRSGDSFVIDSVALHIVHPTTEWVENELDPNENSLVIVLQYGDFSMLLTGDAGLPAEERFVRMLSDVDVLKVGHHGSASSTSPELLEVGRPSVGVISVGQWNTYGHPSPGVLADLAFAGVDVVRTDMGGTVTIWSNGDYFDIRQQSRKSYLQGFLCLLPISSLSSGSSSRRNACTREPQATSRAYSTTSP